MSNDIKILYKDKYLAAVIKPSGILSQDSENEPNMPELLKKELSASYIGTVHRLDKNVSGVMVYSLQESITGKLCGIFSDKALCDKEYYAVIKGAPDKMEDTLEDLLYHDKLLNKTFVVKTMRKGVKPAILNYRVIEQNMENSLVRVSLLTGRTHQIRVQFSSRGLPIVGDGKYGGGKGDIALWSYKIAFKHPISGKKLEFTEIPDLKSFGFGEKTK